MTEQLNMLICIVFVEYSLSARFFKYEKVKDIYNRVNILNTTETYIYK